MVKKETKINLNKSDTSCVVEMEPLRPEEVSLNVFVETCSCLVSHPFTRTRGLLVWKSVLSFMKKQDDFYTFHPLVLLFHFLGSSRFSSLLLSFKKLAYLVHHASLVGILEFSFIKMTQSFRPNTHL